MYDKDSNCRCSHSHLIAKGCYTVQFYRYWLDGRLSCKTPAEQLAYRLKNRIGLFFWRLFNLLHHTSHCTVLSVIIVKYVFTTVEFIFIYKVSKFTTYWRVFCFFFLSLKLNSQLITEENWSTHFKDTVTLYSPFSAFIRSK